VIVTCDSATMIEPELEESVIKMLKCGKTVELLGFTWPVSNTLVTALTNLNLIEGSALEFGVYSGASITKIANHLTDRTVYGFDSFCGLPDAFADKLPKGHFDIHGLVPKVPNNVEICKGKFEDTLESFLKTHNGPASFVHLDADLYSSTMCAMKELIRAKWLVVGTVLVFDEMFNYSKDWKTDGEFKALCHLLRAFPGLNFECVFKAAEPSNPPQDTFDYQKEQVALIVTGVPLAIV
jgi:hypothetical protein